MNAYIHSKNFVLKYRAIIILSFFFSMLLFTLPACNEETSTELIGNSQDNVSVGFYSERTAAGSSSLVITEAKFLVKDMTLKYEHWENECGVKIGPFVVYLDFTPKVIIAAIGKIPYGNYDAVKFHVHKPNPNDNISDPDFIESTSRRYSVVVKGLYNNVPFIYKSKINVVKKIDVENHAITVAATPVMNITIMVDPYEWFFENGDFLDPAIEQNEHKIDDNIKRSLRRAFKDIDLNGIPD